MVVAYKALNKVCHWLISSSSLLLVECCLLGLAALAREEAVGDESLLRLGAMVICTLSLHFCFCGFGLLLLLFDGDEIFLVHLNNLFWLEFPGQDFSSELWQGNEHS